MTVIDVAATAVVNQVVAKIARSVFAVRCHAGDAAGMMSPKIVVHRDSAIVFSGRNGVTRFAAIGRTTATSVVRTGNSIETIPEKIGRTGTTTGTTTTTHGITVAGMTVGMVTGTTCGMSIRLLWHLA